MNWDWDQIFRDAIIALGLAFAFCTMLYLFGF
jgi:hypothetical protein